MTQNIPINEWSKPKDLELEFKDDVGIDRYLGDNGWHDIDHTNGRK